MGLIPDKMNNVRVLQISKFYSIITIGNIPGGNSK